MILTRYSILCFFIFFLTSSSWAGGNEPHSSWFSRYLWRPKAQALPAPAQTLQERIAREPFHSQHSPEGAFFHYVHDRVEQVRLLNRNQKKILLALGNPWSFPSADRQKKACELANALIQDGYLIYYDEDSLYSETFRRCIPADSRVGVSGNRPESPDIQENALYITNPYIRLVTLLNIPQIIISTDSLLSLGILLNYTEIKSRLSVWDPYNLWNNGLLNWQAYLDSREKFPKSPRNLGVNFSETVQLSAFSSLPTLMETLKSQFLAGVPEIKLSFDPLETGKEAQHYEAAWYKLLAANYHRRRISLFGSFFGSEEYNEVVKNYVRRETSPLVTWTTFGSGGFIFLANQIAYQNGFTIGIVHEGAQKDLDSFYLNVRIPTSNPAIRTALGLLTKDFVFAPGDQDTLFALSLICAKLSASSNLDVNQILFLGRSYYGPLIQWMNTLDLPDRLKQEIYLY